MKINNRTKKVEENRELILQKHVADQIAILAHMVDVLSGGSNEGSKDFELHSIVDEPILVL